MRSVHRARFNNAGSRQALLAFTSVVIRRPRAARTSEMSSKFHAAQENSVYLLTLTFCVFRMDIPSRGVSIFLLGPRPLFSLVRLTRTAIHTRYKYVRTAEWCVNAAHPSVRARHAPVVWMAVGVC